MTTLLIAISLTGQPLMYEKVKPETFYIPTQERLNGCQGTDWY